MGHQYSIAGGGEYPQEVLYTVVGTERYRELVGSCMTPHFPEESVISLKSPLTPDEIALLSSSGLEFAQKALKLSI